MSGPDRPPSGEERARQARLGELLAGALQQEGAAREAWLAEACGDDEGLRLEALSLLRDEEGGAERRVLEAVESALGREAAAAVGFAAGLDAEATLHDDLHAPEAGRRIGPYRLEGELGRGGMGVVHRAFDERLQRPVALKSLAAPLVRDAAQLRRLEREARSLASVNHPNVATIHGMEHADGACYLVLELVEGETVHQRLRRGALPLDEAVDLCSQAAAGLDAVHRRGLVHRDLKPSNLVITPEGTVKLLDFGLALQVLRRAEDELTERGVIAGTPGWMSPEQLRGEELDVRSDAWAWGCLLFECLAGAPAFGGGSIAERDAATLEREPTWSELPADLPEHLRSLLADCLSKDRRDRPATLEEARRRLRSAEPSARRARSPRQHSIPAERDEFIGRSAALRDLTARLASGARLVSVLGTGGSGKTRLVTRLAHEQLEQWTGGAWFCDLSEARSLEGIIGAVAAGLDAATGSADPIETLGRVLAGRGRCLVVLDNFEQVARYADDTLGRWLDAAPEASFVVTTRELLGLPGESSLALAPLEPEEAVSLFAARAHARGRPPAPEDAEAVGRLVELLDRLPLAIELAAARTRVLNPSQLLQRMNDRFRLLSTGSRRRERQATLEATLDWSWELLSVWERRALAQASVFEGGFTLEAAEAVLDLSGGEDAPWPMDVVQALVDKSLLLRSGEDRFDLLVSVQEYADRHLGEEERAASRERHGRYFAELVTGISGTERGAAPARRPDLAPELENFIAACRRALQHGDGAVAASALAGAFATILRRGPLATAVELSEQLLGLSSLSDRDRAATLATLGNALDLVGEKERAKSSLDEALQLARRAGDRRILSGVLNVFGRFEITRGRAEEAVALYGEALELSRELGRRLEEGDLLASLGHAHFTRGRMEEAQDLLERALEIQRETGDLGGQGRVLSILGNLHLRTGRPRQARDFFTKALPLQRGSGDLTSAATTLGNLAIFHVEDGELDEALVVHEQALAMHRHVGHRGGEGVALGNMGDIHVKAGRADAARECLESALRIHRETGYRYGAAHWLAALTDLALDEGRPQEAVSLAEQCLEAAAGYADLEPRFAATLVRARLAAGDRAGAWSALEAGEAFPSAGATRLSLRCLRGRLLVEDGRIEEARHALADAEEVLREIGAPPESGFAKTIESLRGEIDEAGDSRRG